MNLSSQPHCYPYPPPPVSHLSAHPPPAPQQPSHSHPLSHPHPHPHPHQLHHPHSSASPRHSSSLPSAITATMPVPVPHPPTYPPSAAHQSAYPGPPHPQQPPSSTTPYMYPQYITPSHHPSAYPLTVMSQGSAQLYPPPPQPQPQHQQQPQHSQHSPHSQTLHPSSNPPQHHPHVLVHHHHPQVPSAYLPRYSHLALQPHPASFVTPSNLNPTCPSITVNPAAHPHHPPPPHHLSHPHHHSSHPQVPQPTVVSTAIVASTPVPQRPLPSERDAFYAKLHSFRDSIGEPIQRLPTLGFKELDLCVLYAEVTKRNGIDAVIANKQWKEVAEALRLPSSCTDSGFRLRLHYKKYLEAFERKYFQPSRPHSTPSLQPPPTSSSVSAGKPTLTTMGPGCTVPSNLSNTQPALIPSSVPVTSSPVVLVSSALSISSNPACSSTSAPLPTTTSVSPSLQLQKVSNHESGQQLNKEVFEQNVSSTVAAEGSNDKPESGSSSEALSIASGPTDPGSLSAGSSGSSGSLGAGMSGMDVGLAGNGVKHCASRVHGLKKKKRPSSSPSVPANGMNDKLYRQDGSCKTDPKDSKRREGPRDVDSGRTNCNRSTLEVATLSTGVDQKTDLFTLSRKRSLPSTGHSINGKGDDGVCRDSKRNKLDLSSMSHGKCDDNRQGYESDKKGLDESGFRNNTNSQNKRQSDNDDSESAVGNTTSPNAQKSKVELQRSEVETLLDFIQAVRRC